MRFLSPPPNLGGDWTDGTRALRRGMNLGLRRELGGLSGREEQPRSSRQRFAQAPDSRRASAAGGFTLMESHQTVERPPLLYPSLPQRPLAPSFGANRWTTKPRFFSPSFLRRAPLFFGAKAAARKATGLVARNPYGRGRLRLLCPAPEATRLRPLRAPIFGCRHTQPLLVTAVGADCLDPSLFSLAWIMVCHQVSCAMRFKNETPQVFLRFWCFRKSACQNSLLRSSASPKIAPKHDHKTKSIRVKQTSKDHLAAANAMSEKLCRRRPKQRRQSSEPRRLLDEAREPRRAGDEDGHTGGDDISCSDRFSSCGAESVVLSKT